MPGRQQDLRPEVGVAAAGARRRVDDRRHPAGHERVRADPVDVDVVDDRHVARLQPLGERLGAAVEPGHAGARRARRSAGRPRRCREPHPGESATDGRTDAARRTGGRIRSRPAAPGAVRRTPRRARAAWPPSSSPARRTRGGTGRAGDHSSASPRTCSRGASTGPAGRSSRPAPSSTTSVQAPLCSGHLGVDERERRAQRRARRGSRGRRPPPGASTTRSIHGRASYGGGTAAAEQQGELVDRPAPAHRAARRRPRRRAAPSSARARAGLGAHSSRTRSSPSGAVAALRGRRRA